MINQSLFEVNSLESYQQKYIELFKYSISQILINYLPKVFYLTKNKKNKCFFLYSQLIITSSKSSVNQNNFSQKSNPYFIIKLPFIYLLKKNNKKLIKLPKLNIKGNFIHNGINKTFLSSLRKTDGIYFTSIRKENEFVILANIFFFGFFKLSFELNSVGLYIYLNDFKIKFNVIVFLNLLGISNNKLLKLSRYGDTLFFKQIIFSSLKEYKQNMFINFIKMCFFIEFYNINFNLKFIFKKENYFHEIQNKYLNLEYQNKIIGVDIINLLDILIDLKLNKKTYFDLDHLDTKNINTFGSLLYNIISNLLDIKIKKSYEDKVSNKLKNILFLFKYKQFSISIQEILTINPLLQYLEQVNTLSEVMHKNRLNNLFNFKQKTTSTRTGTYLREIKPNYLGKLCILHTSEGVNSGLILYLASKTKITNNNIFPLYLYNKDNRLSTFMYITKYIQESTKISILNNYTFRKQKHFNKYIMINLKKNNLQIDSLKSYLTISNIFSYAENLIPFLYNNDPSRTLMGARMLSQAIPLIYKQKARIITGLETSIVEQSNYIYTVYSESIVTYVSNIKIILRDIFNRQIIYYLQKYKKTNQGNIINQYPLVWVGERVLPGQLLVQSYNMINNEFSIGNNLSIMYGTYYGSEHEDALVINKKLINNNLFSSLHFEIYETSLSFKNKSFPEYSTILLPKKSFFIKRNLDYMGIIKEGSFCLNKDILVAKLFINKITTISNDIYKLILFLFGQSLRNIQDCSLINSIGNSGRIVKIEFSLLNKFSINKNYLKLRLFLCKYRLLSIGDKLTGRHGNKGIISQYIDELNIPYNNTYFNPDIIMSSLSISSRMNLGQLFEGIFGLIGVLKNKQFLLNPTFFNKNCLKKKTILYSKLNSFKLNLSNIFGYNPYIPGKYLMRDGIYGTKFKDLVFVGNAYFFKLIHMIKDKFYTRTIGLYNEITQEPIKGRSKGGGQRFGEMEVWAMEAYGASYNLKEILSHKSNDLEGRSFLYKYILGHSVYHTTTISESLRLILRELNGIAINLSSFVIYNLKNIEFLDLNVNF